MSDVTWSVGPIEFELLDGVEADHYEELRETIEGMFPFELSEEDKLKIISLVVGVCHHCYEDDSSCQCWNDI